MAELRADVDDASEPPPRHARQHGLAAQEHAAEIDGDHLVPHRHRHVRQRRRGDDPRIVDEHVDAPKRGLRDR